MFCLDYVLRAICIACQKIHDWGSMEINLLFFLVQLLFSASDL